LPDRCGFAASICGGGLRRDDQRLCRPDVRRGCASPQPFKSNWGYAPRSAFGPKQGIARTEGEAQSLLDINRRGRASPHIGAA